jgi:hypothetical protein
LQGAGNGRRTVPDARRRQHTGPKSATGLEQSRKARWRHGRRSAESRAAAWKRGEARAVLIALRRLLDEA